jgi:hypothetical protein
MGIPRDKRYVGIPRAVIFPGLEGDTRDISPDGVRNLLVISTTHYQYVIAYVYFWKAG